MNELVFRLAVMEEGVPVPVDAELNPKELDLEFVDLHYQSPLRVQGSVEKGPDTLAFRGTLSSRLELMCGRCLKRMEKTVECPFQFYFETQGKEAIDPLPELRDVMLLEHSNSSYLCKEKCSGLCPHCGKDLNEGQCKCRETSEKNNSFEKLKDLWKSKKQEKKDGKS